MIETSKTVLADILPALKAPFDPADIDFLPKSQFEKEGKTFCVGMPYADPRVYQDRLNEVCPGEWSTQSSVTVAGNKVITLVTVTVCGLAHTDIGESFLTGIVRGERKDEENTATEAYAQAFKRACSQFGLGRFLYSLQKQYLPYDKAKKRITLSENERKGLVRQMYQKAGLLREEAPASRAQQSQSGNQCPANAPQSNEPDPAGPVTEQQRKCIRDLCKQLGNKKVALPANHLAAEELIGQLDREYRQASAS